MLILSLRSEGDVREETVRDNVRICLPRLMQVGAGARKLLPQMLAALPGATRPLIVTDRMMVQLGVADEIREMLTAAGYEVGLFDAVQPDPTVSSVLAAVEMLEQGGYDCVIGLGGGSSLDAAKAVAVFSRHSRDIQFYRPPCEFNEPSLPLIAIPTTAGTGSEVTHHTVLIDDSTREKISCRGEAFVPQGAIVDYELTLSKPARLTADNALDTLTHAIEAYVSPKRTLFSDRMALDCMRLVGAHIETVRNAPENRAAREGLMLAAMFGGLAFSNASVGLVHGMSRPLGSTFHVPHGMSNAMLLPALVDFSLQSAPDRYADCARAIGLATDADDDAEAGRKLIAGLKEWNSRLSVPTLRSFGIDVDSFRREVGRMVDEAIASGAHRNSPRIADRDEIVALYDGLIAAE